MSHSLILERLSDYSMRLDPQDDVRMQYLFFVASIAKDGDLIHQDKDFFYNIAISLLNHHEKFLKYNKLMLNRAMSNKQLYRKLSRAGNHAPDEVKHYQVSEEAIEHLLRKCEPLDKDQIDLMVDAMQHTNFDALKLLLFEKQEDYLKCIELIVENNQSSSFLNLKMKDGFAFILEKYFMLQSRVKQKHEDTPQRY